MIGIILAAGSGRRLKINKPKGMLMIGDKPLIQHSVDCLVAAGVNEIIIVTGYRSEHYEKYFHYVNPQDNIKLVHNPEYANCGSLWSLYLGLDIIEEPRDIVILDSDIIYNFDEFNDFINNEYPDAILATNVPDDRHDACYIETDLSDNLVKVSKNINYITHKDNPWEYIGITKSSANTVKDICDYAKNLFDTTATIDHEYDYAFESINHNYKICRYTDYIWSEADDNTQLNYLVTLVYPKLNLFYGN